MKYKLRTRLTISYVLVSLFLVALISLLSNIFLDRQFREYVMTKQEAANIEIVNMISQQWSDTNTNLRNLAVENIGINALERGLIIKVMDQTGSTVWDATVHNNGLCIQMIDHMAQNMNSHYPNFQGGYTVKEYPLQQGAELVGRVAIGYYGPYYYNDYDLAFIETLNKVLGLVALVSLLLALSVGAFTARRLSYPISRAVTAARGISRGQYNGRISEISNTIEIDELTYTINDLAEGLDQQEKLRRRLTTDVAHELRTPLATLQSHVEAMIDGIWDPDKTRLESCHEEILRINRLVGDLENLAHYESEGLVLFKERFDLAELAGSMVRSYEAKFREHQIKLSYTGEPCFVYADRDKISQVIINLLSNAMKYTPSGGNVELYTGTRIGESLIRVRDTGTGIAPEDLPHIFERFYRADQSRNRLSGGSGVGLAIVKAIVDAHGGKVKASSTPQDGTEFTVILPDSPT